MKEIIESLLDDNVVILPTDTVYGLSCIYDSSIAIDKLYKIKKRPETFLFTRHYSTIDMILHDSSLILNDNTIKMMHHFFPGPLTLITENNIGIRVPDNKILSHIINMINKPLYMTSVNIHGQKEIYDINIIKNTFKNILYVENTEYMSKQPSTIAKVTEDIQIIRQGCISYNDMLQVIRY